MKEKDLKKSIRILYIGNFGKLWDEEYIAQAFESLGHEVGRVKENSRNIIKQIEYFKPDVVLWAKLKNPLADIIVDYCKQNNIKTVCWVWDLYWGYMSREHRITEDPMFKADLVFTSDGGEHQWKEVGIKHKCIRQGIHEPECRKEEGEKENDVIFVGGYNKFNTQRNEILEKIEKDFDFKWFGRNNTDEVRGMKLNRLFGKSKIVVGDSVYSPYYWSNRVVETLGRGGFLIHQEVEGIKEAYPYLVTYERGNYQDLKKKIQYYLKNTEEREDIINKNLKWVKDNHLCKHRCQELCENL